MQHDPQVQALVDEARAVTCIDYAQRQKWPLKKSGDNYAGPCPKCGGDDRFAIDARQNLWHCRGCSTGGSDSISLVMAVDNGGLVGETYGRLFISACERITGRTAREAISEEEIARRKREQEQKRRDQERESERRREEARKWAFDIWRRADIAGEIVKSYLEARRIPIDPGLLMNCRRDRTSPAKAYSSIRETAALPYVHDFETIYKGPAMVLAIQASDGKFSGVHRTWIDTGPTGKKGKAVIIRGGKALESKKVLGTKADGAIRIYTPPDARRIVMGEGFETTVTPLVYAKEPGTAYWAGIDLNHIAGRAARDPETGSRLPRVPDMRDLKCFLLPDWCEEFVLLVDGDSERKWTNDMIARAVKRHSQRREGVLIKVVHPGDGRDMNDLAFINGSDGSAENE